ncbi:MAG: hypothetical protein Kow00122_13320 [Thermoleophilia bacterium]
MALALAALGWRARRRRGYPPLVLGAVAAVLVFVGRFALTSDLVAYIGAALLVTASAWNAWPVRGPGNQACPSFSHPDRPMGT